MYRHKAREPARFEAAMYNQPDTARRYEICIYVIAPTALVAYFWRLVFTWIGEERTFSKFDTIVIEFAFYPVKILLNLFSNFSRIEDSGTIPKILLVR